jgi:hypothetical protein
MDSTSSIETKDYPERGVPIFKVDDLDIYISDGRYFNETVKGLFEGYVFNHPLGEIEKNTLNLDLEGAKRFLNAQVDGATKEGRGCDIVKKDEKGNEIFVGFISHYPVDNAPDYPSPAGWEAAITLEEQAVEKFEKSKGSMKSWWRGETGFSNANVRGKKIAGLMEKAWADWNNKVNGMKGYYAFFSGKYLAEMCIDAGFKIGSRILYSEAEFNGQKVYKDVKPSKAFY